MSENSTVSIGILNYRQAQASAIQGLVDLFRIADRMHRDDHPGRPRSAFDTVVIDSIGETDGSGLSVVIVPPSLGEERIEADEDSARWLFDVHGRGVLVCSVCAGAFLLAQSGLLDGRAATTHWALAERFRHMHPSVRLDTDKLLIDDGDIVTAGGLMAWIDLGLRVVDRYLGPSAMLATARFMLVDPGGREQRFYSVFSPRLNHGDAAVLRTQHWLQTKYDQPLLVDEMARHSGLSPRTFLRRFHRATGFNPSDYLQHLRIGKARILLEAPGLNVDEIAWQVGYSDTSSFRRIFQKVVGLTPREYRNRFAAPEGSTAVS